MCIEIRKRFIIQGKNWIQFPPKKLPCMLRAAVERQMNEADKLKTLSWIQSGEGSVIFNSAIL